MFLWLSKGPVSSYRVSNDLEKLQDHLTKKYSLGGVPVSFHEEESGRIEVGMLGAHLAAVIGYIYEVEEL